MSDNRLNGAQAHNHTNTVSTTNAKELEAMSPFDLQQRSQKNRTKTMRIRNEAIESVSQ